VRPELLAGLPAISTPGMSFDQTELRAAVGQTVALPGHAEAGMRGTLVVTE